MRLRSPWRTPRATLVPRACRGGSGPGVCAVPWESGRSRGGRGDGRRAGPLVPRPRCVFDPHQAALMTQNLRKRGVKLSEYVFSQQSISRLALNLHGLLRDHRIGLPDDPDLLDELAAVELREVSPGVYRVDHSRNAHDDRAIAVGLAALELVSRRVRRRSRSRVQAATRGLQNGGWRSQADRVVGRPPSGPSGEEVAASERDESDTVRV